MVEKILYLLNSILYIVKVDKLVALFNLDSLPYITHYKFAHTAQIKIIMGCIGENIVAIFFVN